MQQFHEARPKAGDLTQRLAKVRSEIAATGTYRHTPAELAFGARIAVRESGWCPDSVPWRGVLVRDLRGIRDAAEVAEECVRHLRMAAGGGQVRPMVSVFAPDTPWRVGPRIRNDQLVRYAGYSGGQGVLGDRRFVDFATAAARQGWMSPAEQGPFDSLPLVVETEHEGIRLHPVPRAAVLEVPLAHPDLPWFAGLALRWHAVPVISNMRLHIGGITYPAAPFNGVYMAKTIGEDVLADDAAYGYGRLMAERLGLDTSTERSLWRQRVAVEFNRAVLHSFDRAGVSIEHAPEAYLPAVEPSGGPAFLRQTRGRNR